MEAGGGGGGGGGGDERVVDGVGRAVGLVSRWLAEELKVSLEERDAERQKADVQHAFLEDVRSGTVDTVKFNTWIAQDYVFVTEFARLIAHATALAPGTPALKVYCSGVGALSDELQWFEAKAAERGIDLKETIPTPATASYCEFLQTLRGEGIGFATLAVAVYTIEKTYNSAWSSCLSADGPYRAFAERWGSREFGEYCESLLAIAESAVAGCSAKEAEAARDALVKVLELEVEFWPL
eukprot:jgi/Chlat1/7691/Chrsp64S07176